MKNRIKVIKGSLGNIKIYNTIFELLKPVETIKGISTAYIGYSDLFGSPTTINIEDYKILD